MMNQTVLRITLLLLYLATTYSSGNENIVDPFGDLEELIKIEANLSDKNKREKNREYEIGKVKTMNNSKEKESTKTQEEKGKDEIQTWLNNFPEVEDTTKVGEFINEIGPIAVVIAEEKGIYPSVMIAQAGLESAWGSSDLAKKHNNLMGTKGSNEEKKVTLKTSEEVSGEEFEIDADFRVYDSWRESLNHYGKMMREGLEWDNNYYEGTWRENAEDYKEATASLVGRYATDSAYDDKLNATIEKYDLARFDQLAIDYDYEKILNNRTIKI